MLIRTKGAAGSLHENYSFTACLGGEASRHLAEASVHHPLILRVTCHLLEGAQDVRGQGEPGRDAHLHMAAPPRTSLGSIAL